METSFKQTKKKLSTLSMLCYSSIQQNSYTPTCIETVEFKAE